jgi:dihydrofolate reductase
MRKLIVTNIVSLDGFFEGPGGNVLALPMDAAFDAYNCERLRAADILLLGRRTFEMFQGFWPTMIDHPQATPTHREIARLNGAIAKRVVSDKLSQAELSGAWASTATVVSGSSAHEHIAELKRTGDKDILIFGSRTLWNDLLKAGLVDELHLMVGNVVLGAGTPAFHAGAKAELELLGMRRWETSSNVMLKYAVRR